MKEMCALRKQCLISLIVLGIAAALALRSTAQQMSDLSGELRDRTHALVPGATLVMTQDATGVSQQTHTNGAGAYYFSLAPGTYTMDITAHGFNPVHRPHIIIEVGQAARLDFLLQVGGVEQTVNVNAETEELNESTAVGTVITEQEIARLPVNGTDQGGNYGRNYTSLVLLTPGSSDISLAGSDGTISGTNSFSVNGQRNPDNNYTLDGVDNNFFHKQAPGLSPPMDSLKEFRVATNNSSEFGRSAGANIALVTKSGSRELHGSFYEYARQALFDANYWFYDHDNFPKQPYHYNEYGMTLGGPVLVPRIFDGRKDLFWFFSYEGFGLRQSQEIESNVPTALERTGVFSEIKETIYDPLTAVQNPSTGVITRTAFTGNAIPGKRLDPAALAYINDFLPLPNLPTGSAGGTNYINTTPERNNRDVFVGRLDYHLDARNSLFFRILDQNATDVYPESVPAFTQKTSFSGINYAAGWDVILNDKNLLQMRFGFNNPQGPAVTRNTLGITRSQFFAQSGIQIFAPVAPYNVLPSIDAVDFSISETGGTSIDDVYEANATYSRTMGAALVKFGLLYQPRHYYHDATSPTSGTATYSVAQSNSNGLASNVDTGSGTASFLLGYPYTVDRGEGTADVDAIQKYYGAFVVYNRKISRRLTTEAGLRYEFYLPPHDKLNRLGTLWVHDDPVSNSVTGTLLWAGVNPLPDFVTGAVNDPPNRAGFGEGLAQVNAFNFMPRIGLAYLIEKRLILRAGYGLYDNTTDFQEVQDERKFYPYNFEQLITTNTGVLPDTTLESPGPSYTNTANTTQALAGYAQDPGKKTPYSQQYNLTIEGELPGNVMATIAYVGSVNKHEIGYEPFNTAPLPDPNTADIATLNSRRLLPQYGDIYQGANRYKSNYNALQISARRHYRNGFEFQTNYTYGRSLDNQSSLGEFKTQDPFNPGPDYSRSSFDLTHIFNLSFVYDLPVGRGRRFGTQWPKPVDAFAGGWSIESINRYETGPPVNVTLGGLDVANTGYAGETEQRPNVSGNPNAAPHSITKWFNTAAFSVPNFGTYGNSRAFIVDAGGLRRTDLSIYKRFITYESQTLDFRAGFFNLPNTPSWAAPKVNIEAGGSFGTVNSTRYTPRQVQLALRYTF